MSIGKVVIGEWTVEVGGEVGIGRTGRQADRQPETDLKPKRET